MRGLVVASQTLELRAPLIWDTVDDRDYLEPDFPAEILLSHVVEAEVYGYNLSSESQYMSIMIEMVDPDGHSEGKRQSAIEHLIGAGNPLYIYSNEVALAKPGYWQLHATLWSEGDEVDDRVWNAVHVGGEAPPPPPPPPEVMGFPWVVVVLGVGVLSAGILVASRRRA